MVLLAPRLDPVAHYLPRLNTAYPAGVVKLHIKYAKQGKGERRGGGAENIM